MRLSGRSKAIPDFGQPSLRWFCSTGLRTGARCSTGSNCSAEVCRRFGSAWCHQCPRPRRVGKSDPDFDLAFHVRRVDAPGPATIDTLLEMARIAAMADFDRARPLWEVTLIDGLANGGAALLCKLHHSLTDGIGAVGIAMTLYDAAPDYEHRALPQIPATSVAGHLGVFLDSIAYEANLAASAIADSVKAGPGLLASSILHPFSTAAGFGALAASVVRTARPTRRPGSPIMVKRNHHRRLAVHEVPTEHLRQAGKTCGGSLNDAFIAAVAGGLRRYHEKHAVAVGALRCDNAGQHPDRRGPGRGQSGDFDAVQLTGGRQAPHT